MRLLHNSGVSSYPIRCAEIETDAQWAEAFRFFRETINFLRKKFGDSLVNVSVHLDEEFPHCHFYCLPKAGHGKFNMLDLHPGITAQENILPARKGGSKEERKLRDKAYVEAMRLFQDDYYDEVAVLFGMDRIGPRRERLSRDEWQSRQRENERKALETKLWRDRLELAEERSREAEERVRELEALLVKPEA